MTICKFRSLFNDLEDGEKVKLWTCDQERDSKTQFCCFHDKTKQQWDYRTFERIHKMILDKERTGEKLLLIGYFFPNNISFKLLLEPDPNPPPKDGITRDINRRTYTFPVYLCNAEFNGQVEFSHCTFDKALNLSGAIFRREVLFRDTIFKGKFYPRSTRFYGKVDFRKTEFDNTDFHDTVFKDKANFRRSKFLGETDSDKRRFLDVKFQDRVNFVGTEFSSETRFIGTTFNKAFFAPNVKFLSNTEFKYVVFEDGEKILFATENLTKVSFINTDITRVRFSDKVTWSDDAKNKFKIYDEKQFDNSFRKLKYQIFTWKNIPKNESDSNRLRNFLGELRSGKIVGIEVIHFNKRDGKTLEITHKGDPNLSFYIRLDKEKNNAVLIKQGKEKEEEVLYEFIVEGKYNPKLYPHPEVSLEGIRAIYRNLRENYEYRLRYDEAGEFFIREMELKRNYHQDPNGRLKETHKIRKRLSITGLYYYLFKYGERLLRPTLVVVLPFLGLSILLSSIAHEVSLMEAIKISFADMLQIELQEPLKPLFSDSIIRILSLGILGMYLIPLRRKFERRFRH